MALKYSTCLRNKMFGGVPARHVAKITATTIAAVDGGGGNDSFTDSGNGFITAGFSVGDSVIAYGFTGDMASIVGPFTLLSVEAGTMEVATGSLAANVAGDSVTIVVLAGGSLRDIFKDGVLRIYSGAQPTSPDDSIAGATALVTITVDGGAFVAGSVANGLEFGLPVEGVISKTGDDWEGVVSVSGIASWFRLCANGTDDGSEDTTFTKPRIDGSVGTSGRDLNLSTVSLVAGRTQTIDTFELTFPES